MSDAPNLRTGHAIPRGIATTGPVLFSYGFRPFFLGAGIWAIAAMALWIVALSTGRSVGGSYGALHWHSHEMLFGFSSAVLAGFLLTAVPNWTGSLPVSGKPLIMLFGLWVAGRLTLIAPDLIGIGVAVAIDALFLPTLLYICAREIIAGRKWKDLKVLAGLTALSVANIAFHYQMLSGADSAAASRLSVSAYVLLIMIVGGRVVPSFTRNWLNRFGRTDFPVPYNRFDIAALWIGLAALSAWVIVPDHPLTLCLALVAAVVHAVRLYRWRGWTTRREKLLVVLHVAYAFIPAGFLAIAAAAAGIFNELSALHVLTVGAMGCMMLAMMGRATRGHTGRDLSASRITVLSYAYLILAALTRPLAEVMPMHFHHLLALAGVLWIAAFAFFLVEYTPMLTRVRRGRQA
ncbi:MAG: NnrS family protein [Phyllobacterium sp.]